MALGKDHMNEVQRSQKCDPQTRNHIDDEQRNEECDPQLENLRPQRNKRLP